MEILRHRIQDESEAKALLECESTEELLDAKDYHDLQADEAKESEQQQALKSRLRKSARRKAELDAEAAAACTRAVKGKISKGKGKKTKPDAAAVGESQAKKPKKYPAKLKLTKCTVEDLNMVLPDVARITLEGRTFRLTLSPTGKQFTRDIAFHGEEHAAKLLLKKAWQWAVDNAHETACPFAELGVEITEE